MNICTKEIRWGASQPSIACAVAPVWGSARTTPPHPYPRPHKRSPREVLGMTPSVLTRSRWRPVVRHAFGAQSFATFAAPTSMSRWLTEGLRSSLVWPVHWQKRGWSLWGVRNKQSTPFFSTERLSWPASHPCCQRVLHKECRSNKRAAVGPQGISRAHCLVMDCAGKSEWSFERVRTGSSPTKVHKFDCSHRCVKVGHNFRLGKLN